MCENTSVVEQLNTSLRQLARADFKSLHQQRARGEETIWSLLKTYFWANIGFSYFMNSVSCTLQSNFQFLKFWGRVKQVDLGGNATNIQDKSMETVSFQSPVKHLVA